MLKSTAGIRPSTITFPSLFQLVLEDTGLKPSIVAFELQRERSLVYKWLSGASVPPAFYFPLISEIVAKHASETKKMILENDLRELVRKTALPDEIRETVLAAESVERLLFECLELSRMPEVAIHRGRAGPATRSPGQVSVLLGALFAAVCGGVLWNGLNRVLGWPYFMGSESEELRGLRALLWGLITTAPIPAPLLALHNGEARRRLVVPSILFAVFGGLSALVFYSSGIRSAVEGMGFGYTARETLIVVAFALCLSIPPLFAAILPLSRGKLVYAHGILVFSPTVAALLAFFVTLLIDRPVSEILQLRGFVVGFTLRLAVFLSLFRAASLS